VARVALGAEPCAVEKHVKKISQKLRLAPAESDHRRALAVLL
jgi:hypothetical protein